MPKITKVAPQSKDPSRISVFIDGQFAFGLPRKIAAEMNLKPGLDLEPADLDRLQTTVSDSKTYDRLLRLLAIRAHSRAELLRKLTAKGIPRAAAEKAIARAADSGYVNDSQFAADFARMARDLKSWAPARTRMELRKRGIDKETAESAVADTYDDTDLREQAIELARSRAARLTGDRESRRRRIVGFLERRGYPVHICREAADEVAP